MGKAEVMFVTSVCPSFPNLPDLQIGRENVLKTIEELIKKYDLLIIEGEKGIGKTTLLAQYARNNPNLVISSFIQPTNLRSYDPDKVEYDLCNQLMWILYQKELNDFHEANSSLLNDSFLKLSRMAERKNQKYVVLFDGLDEVPENENYVLQRIVNLFPFGNQNLKFIFSGETKRLPKRVLENVNYKSFFLSGLSKEESILLFDDLEVEEDLVEELIETFGGNPGTLTTVKRLLEDGVNLQDPKNRTEKLSGLFEIEWRQAEGCEDEFLDILAFLAFSNSEESLDFIANFWEKEKDEVQNFLSELSFILISEEKVSFISPSFRDFAKNKLKNKKEFIQGKIVEQLMKKPDSERSIYNLPELLEECGETEKLLDFLDKSFFWKLFRVGRTQSHLYDKSKVGLKTAIKYEQLGQIFRFGLQKSIIGQFEGLNIFESEISALIALENIEQAISLAQSAMLKEDRLHLLSLVGRKLVEKKHPLSKELKKEIEKLFNEIDPLELGEKGINIAAELIFVFPEKALNLVENIMGTEGDENALDWAFAKLSIATIESKEGNLESGNALDKILSRIKNPFLKDFSTHASIILEDYSGEEFISEIEKNEKINERLFLASLWLRENRELDEVVFVLEWCLDQIITNQDYSPGNQLLREISTPLPFIKDIQKTKKISNRIERILSTIEHLGPTIDVVRLKLILAETYSKWDKKNAIDRYVDIYLIIEKEIENLEVRSNCAARLLSSLSLVDQKREFEEKESLHSITEDLFSSCIEELLSFTADHYQVTKGPIRALAKSLPNKALLIIDQINTEPRRDKALKDLLSSMIDARGKLDYALLWEIIEKIEDYQVKDQCIVEVLKRIFDEKEETKNLFPNSKLFLQNVYAIRNLELRCQACCIGYGILDVVDEEEKDSYKGSFLNLLERTWEEIENDWEKIDVGFKIIETICQFSEKTAYRFSEKVEEIKENVLFIGYNSLKSYLSSVFLLIQSFKGLIPNNLYNENDLKGLDELIKEIPSDGYRAVVWSRIALNFFARSFEADGKKIVLEYVKPNIEKLVGMEEPEICDWAEVLFQVAPALYLFHQKTTLELIEKFPTHDRDIAYKNICFFILRKKSPNEPYEEGPSQSYNLEYEEILDLIQIIEVIENDSLIFNIVGCITNSINKQKHSKQVVSEVIRKLEEVVDKKLPNNRFIKHKGFLISCQILINKLKEPKKEEWIKIYEETKKIPNGADRCFVLGLIAENLPTKRDFETYYEEIITLAEELAERIPSFEDKIERFNMLANCILKKDKGRARKILKKAVEGFSSSKPKGKKDEEIQKELIDTAFLIDQDFARGLTSLFDDDPARQENIKNRLKILEARGNLHKKEFKGDENFSHEDFIKLAFVHLKALNSGRMIPIDDVKKLYNPLNIASRIKIERSYTIYAWAIENLIIKYSGIDKMANKLLRPLFDAIFQGLELAKIMRIYSSDRIENIKEQKAYITQSKNKIFTPGTRKEALEFLKGWLGENIQSKVKICDPYFGPKDLLLVKIIQQENPECSIEILTSLEHHKNKEIKENIEEIYNDFWRIEIGAQEPPKTKIVVVGVGNRGSSPIHDRYIVAEKAGLRLGTSFNSLGVGKKSEISFLSEGEALEIAKDLIDPYLNCKERNHGKEKLSYKLLYL